VGDRVPAAILGASGLIGQHFARLLDDHPRFEVTSLLAGERESPVTLGSVWQLPEDPPRSLADLRITSVGPAALARSGVRIAFSALPSGVAGPVETELRRRGVSVFSNASDHRMDDDVPLLVPEVNAAHLRALARPGRPLLVTNANCTTTGLVLGLAPVWGLLRPKAVHVASYQALSGAGLEGVAALHTTDNVVPYIRGEEEKVAEESRRILGAASRGRVRENRVRVLAHCVRVAVRDGHLEAITVEAAARPALSTLEQAFREFDPLADSSLPTAPHPPVLLRTELDRPQPLRDRWAGAPPRARGMAAVVGRLRWDPPYLRFFVLSHNAVRGGAGGSVLNAELADAEGLLPFPG
jgi:aspartate-semialdehyde dehydrogenase